MVTTWAWLLILSIQVIRSTCLTHGRHRSERSAAATPHTVAVLIAGPPSHHSLGEGLQVDDYISAFQEHIVDPLLPQFDVSVFITCAPNETAEWISWTRNLSGLRSIDISVGGILENRNATRFSDSGCQHPDCYAYWLQYGHLRNTYQAMIAYEAKRSFRFEYIVKARNDVLYKPDNVLEPAWLLALPAGGVAVPSTEFHSVDRWMERRPSFWPKGMCDQIVMGPRGAMDTYFTLFGRRWPSLGPRAGIERILAQHLVRSNVSVATVELQTSQPGGKYNNGRHGAWVDYRCELCLDPNPSKGYPPQPANIPVSRKKRSKRAKHIGDV